MKAWMLAAILGCGTPLFAEPAGKWSIGIEGLGGGEVGDPVIRWAPTENLAIDFSPHFDFIQLNNNTNDNSSGTISWGGQAGFTVLRQNSGNLKYGPRILLGFLQEYSLKPDTDSTEIESLTFGFNTGLGLDLEYFIFSRLSIGAQPGFQYTIMTLNIKDGANVDSHHFGFTGQLLAVRWYFR